MTKPTGSYTIPKPPAWLLILIGGGFASGGGYGLSTYAASSIDVAEHNVAVHNVASGAHPAMLSELSHVSADVETLTGKVDQLLKNQIAICVSLDVDCER